MMNTESTRSLASSNYTCTIRSVYHHIRFYQSDANVNTLAPHREMRTLLAHHNICERELLIFSLFLRSGSLLLLTDTNTRNENT